MSNFREKKRQQNEKTGNVPVKPATQVSSVSKYDADEAAYGTTPTLVRMNRYHKDIVKVAAKKLGMSGAEFIRMAIRDKAQEHGVQ